MTPTLLEMLQKYAVAVAVPQGPEEHPFDYSMNLPISKSFPGCIAFIAFYRQLAGGIEPNLDDLSENLTLGFVRLLKGEVGDREFQEMCWDLREWLGWLHQGSYTWIDLGEVIERHLAGSGRSAA